MKNDFRNTRPKSHSFPIIFRKLNAVALAILVAMLLGACSEVRTTTGIPSALDPRGSAAADIAGLWWMMFVLGTLVFLLVTGLLLYSIFQRRRHQPGSSAVDRSPDNSRPWIWYGGIVLPSVIIAVVLFFTLRSLTATAQPSQDAAAEIEIIGRQWFWDVRYPDENFDTANEMYIPVGQPVLLRLTSADVIHSFWVPQLHGKIDLLPGRTNTFWMQADEPGIFRGICAEFCGVQHAHMQFIVVAVSADEYASWVEQQRQPVMEAGSGSDQVERGREVFVNGQCAFCHTVRGTEAEGQLGPDLTHFASRQTIAAGTLPNNRGNLGAWVSDPQHIKPGNLMPAVNLTSEELIAVLAFLESLE